MISRRLLLTTSFCAFAGVSLAQHAHNHAAPNGGQIVNVGKFEVELVATAKEIKIFVTDEDEKKVEAKQFAASATVLAQGNRQRTVELKPAADNVLSATYDFPVDGKFRATITLKTDNKEIGRGRFNTDIKR